MIVCLDPGCTSGVVRLKPDGTLVDWVQLKTEEELYGWLSNALRADRTLVYEAYVGSGPRDRYSVDTLLRIGGARAIAVLRGSRVVSHQPQKRKAFLAQAKEIIPGHKNRHAMDALAHGLAYIYYRDKDLKRKARKKNAR